MTHSLREAALEVLDDALRFYDGRKFWLQSLLDPDPELEKELKAYIRLGKYIRTGVLE